MRTLEKNINKLATLALIGASFFPSKAKSDDKKNEDTNSTSVATKIDDSPFGETTLPSFNAESVTLDNGVTILARGLVTLKEDTKVTERVELRYYNRGFGTYAQRVKVKRNEKVLNATITLSEEGKIYFPNNQKDLNAKIFGTNVSFQLRKPTIFATIQDGKIKNVFLLDPATKTLANITQNDTGLSVIEEYNKRELKLNSTSENTLAAGEFVKLERNDENEIIKILIKTDGYSDTITRAGQQFLSSDNFEVNNIKLFADGRLSYDIKKTIDGKKVTFLHQITPDGKHTQKEVLANIFNARAHVLEYTEFGNNNLSEIQSGVLKIAKNQRNIPDKVLLSDAKTTIINAMKNGAMPLFFASYHGARDYNVGTGRDSKWISIIATAAKEVGYNGPIGIHKQHCYSGVSEAEIAALNKCCAGSYIITSQDNRLSYYQPQNSHSADGDTLIEAKNASVLNGIAYFSAKVISQSNNPTAAVVRKDKKVLIFSENGRYPGSTANSTLPKIDERECIEVFKNSGVNESKARSYLRLPKVRFALGILKYASNQSEYSSLNAR